MIRKQKQSKQRMITLNDCPLPEMDSFEEGDTQFNDSEIINGSIIEDTSKTLKHRPYRHSRNPVIKGRRNSDYLNSIASLKCSRI